MEYGYREERSAQAELRGEPRVDGQQVYSPHFRVLHDQSDPERTEAIQETYRLLAVAVFAAIRHWRNEF